MSVIMLSLIQNVIKYVVFIAVAAAAVVCGKKYREYKDSKQAGVTTENKESK